MKVAIVGVGLIGGSMALDLRTSGFATELIGVEKDWETGAKAVQLGLVDSILPLEAAIEAAEMIVLSVSMDAMLVLLPVILDKIQNKIVFDVGSTKEKLLEAVEKHPNRNRFVATHPMAGTEHSGPEAAIHNLFANKYCVLCDVEDSDKDAQEGVIELYKALKMNILYLNRNEHDVHTAYISHISHLTSFALALTVLEKEKDEDKIFELASSGFQSTVRLAKSSPDTWTSIFKQNRDNVLEVLDEHIHILSVFRSLLIKRKFEEFHKMIQQANDIKRILK
jgi:prephenate dehydrogenase